MGSCCFRNLSPNLFEDSKRKTSFLIENSGSIGNSCKEDGRDEIIKTEESTKKYILNVLNVEDEVHKVKNVKILSEKNLKVRDSNKILNSNRIRQDSLRHHERRNNPSSEFTIISKDIKSKINLSDSEEASTIEKKTSSKFRRTGFIIDIRETSLNKMEEIQSRRPSYMNSTGHETNFISMISEEMKITDHRVYNKEPLSVQQATFILNKLSDVDLVTYEMDSEILKQIINEIKYFKIDENHYFLPATRLKASLTSEVMPESEIFIIDKGRIEETTEKETYIYSEGFCFATEKNERFINDKIIDLKNLKTLTTTFIYSINTYILNQIIFNFESKIKLEKFKYISNLPIFRNFDQSKLIGLSEQLERKIYLQDSDDQNKLLSEDMISTKLYIISKGTIICSKNGTIIKKLTEGCYFGDISLFCSVKSFYSYSFFEEAIIYELNHEKIIEVIGHNSIRDIIYNMFISSMKKCEELNKHLNRDILFNLFKLFSLKYYFKNSVCSFKDKKILVIITGRIFKKINLEIVAASGDLFGSCVIDEMEGYSQIISEDECVIFEAPWEDILRSLKCNPNNKITIFERITIMKQLEIFNGLSDWKLFQIADLLKTVYFKNGEIIIKEGSVNDKIFIIKSGTVQVVINDIFIKELNINEYFGDFSILRKSSHPSTFIAKNRVECWILVKENFEEIIGSSQMKPNRNLNILEDSKNVYLDKLFYIKDLGQGSFGKVFQVHDGKNFYGVKVAEIKLLNKNNIFKYFINEKKVMSSIDHPFIVKLINTFKTKEHIFFLMEHIEGFTLKHYLDTRSRVKSRDIYEVQFYGAILLTIANYLQRIRVIHRDIKPSNIMIETNGYLKLIDFGVSKDMIGKNHTATVVGTCHYMPPEMILGKGYTFSADIWTMGVVLYEIFYGCLPFGNNSMGQYEIYNEITEKKLPLPSDTKFLDFNNLLMGLLQKDPNKRICNFSQIKNSPFFKNFKFDLLYNKNLASPAINKKLIKQFKDDTLKEDLFVNSTFPFDNFMENEYYSKKENDFYSSRVEHDFDCLADF